MPLLTHSIQINNPSNEVVLEATGTARSLTDWFGAVTSQIKYNELRALPLNQSLAIAWHDGDSAIIRRFFSSAEELTNAD